MALMTMRMRTVPKQTVAVLIRMPSAAAQPYRRLLARRQSGTPRPSSKHRWTHVIRKREQSKEADALYAYTRAFGYTCRALCLSSTNHGCQSRKPYSSHSFPRLLSPSPLLIVHHPLDTTTRCLASSFFWHFSPLRRYVSSSFFASPCGKAVGEA